MDKLIINGQRELYGNVNISGAKNAALYAISILALYDQELALKLEEYRKNQTDFVLNNRKLVL